MSTPTPLEDLEGADRAYARVQAEIDALSVSELSTLNVDLVSATSIALGVVERIGSFRERLAKLSEFDIKNIDKLADYAKAAWFAHVSNLPIQDQEAIAALTKEATELRGKLLMWAAPLVGSGLFEEAAVARIREGGGSKDTASDLVALVGLYRGRWDDVKGICGVTEAELHRGSQIGPALFAALSRREFQEAGAGTDGSLRVRRAWTLLDRAYTQARRGIAFLRAAEGDVDTIAPNLRRNVGNSSKPAAVAPTPVPAPAGVTPPAPLVTTSSSTSGVRAAVIDAGEPFAVKAKS